MIRDVEPFRSLFKVFWLYGFDFKEISFRHKFFSVAVLIFIIISWSFIFLSLLQAQDIDESTERLLFILTIVEIIFKVINVFSNFDKFKEIIAKFDEAFADEKFLKKASRTALILAKFQLSTFTTTAITATALCFVTHKLTVPMYIINIPGHEELTFWIYKVVHDALFIYSCYILLTLDLMPVGLMALIAEQFNHFNERFSNLKHSNRIALRNDFIKLIKLHRKHKRFVSLKAH